MKNTFLIVILLFPVSAFCLYQKNDKNECVEFTDSIAKSPDYKLVGCEKSSETNDKTTLKCKAEALVVIYPDIDKCKKDGGIIKEKIVNENKHEEVAYRRLQASPEKYQGKLVVMKCEIIKYVADRGVLDGYCGSMGDSTSGPCIYTDNDWICLAVPKEKKDMIEYLIDGLKPGTSTTVKLLGRLNNKKYFNIEEIRFCSSSEKCEPYAKVLK
ncbi:MAG: hypothetical protein J0M15_14985 [Deltaproteobacteria bacterium]|jgi:hypothetical protein|nr:hypothetical protein [Deltaproteobacteria bacterium]